MRWPTLTTYDRTERDAATLSADFERCYLGIRFLIGLLGLALPLALVLVDWWFLPLEAEVRGSMSAYYHSAARDLFVGGLVATGVVLCSYLSWRWQTWDFWLSLVAGLAIFGVAGLPTGRAGVDASATSCTDLQSSGTPACVAVQEKFGEGRIELLHQTSAGVVVASFALLCLVFALREFGYGRAAHAGGELGVRQVWRRVGAAGLRRQLTTAAPRVILYALCGVGIVIGALWSLFGPELIAPPVYVGEFIAFTAFGAAWMTASWDLFRRTHEVTAARVSATIA